MTINPIIKKQSVKIDDHLWGSREEKQWDRIDRDIHLDKRTLTRYNGKNINVTIKIPLNSERKIQIFAKQKGSTKDLEKIPKALEEEIQDAFNDKNVRDTFYSNIASVLEDYKSAISSTDKATRALTKIATAFGLDWHNLIELSFNKNQNNKYYANISDGNNIYQLTINRNNITAKDTMRKVLKR